MNTPLASEQQLVLAMPRVQFRGEMLFITECMVPKTVNNFEHNICVFLWTPYLLSGLGIALGVISLFAVIMTGVTAVQCHIILKFRDSTELVRSTQLLPMYVGIGKTHMQYLGSKCNTFAQNLLQANLEDTFRDLKFESVTTSKIFVIWVIPGEIKIINARLRFSLHSMCGDIKPQ